MYGNILSFTMYLIAFTGTCCKNGLQFCWCDW